MFHAVVLLTAKTKFNWRDIIHWSQVSPDNGYLRRKKKKREIATAPLSVSPGAVGFFS